MKRRLLAILMLCVTGCAYQYQFNTGAPPSGQRVEEWRHIGLWGWIDAAPVDLEQACPSGVSRFGSYISFTNWLPGFFTLGLYAPRTVFIECAQGVAAKPAAPTTSATQDHEVQP